MVSCVPFSDKIAWIAEDKAEMFHMAALEQGTSMDWVNTGPLALKASKELQILDSSDSGGICKKPASEHRYRL
jgi:hypothetical protein